MEMGPGQARTDLDRDETHRLGGASGLHMAFGVSGLCLLIVALSRCMFMLYDLRNCRPWALARISFIALVLLIYRRFLRFNSLPQGATWVAV